MGWLIALAAVTVWLSSGRVLYRRWVRSGIRSPFRSAPWEGYQRRELANGCVAMLAMLAALALPVALAVLFIMAGTPESPADRAGRIAALERENRELDEIIRRSREGEPS